ncbi:MAG: amidohydrolase family protein, partial [Lentisphaerae bacterium]|nr:amidohydrolase family protein [Lentisphaerota bacterium]
VLTPLSKPHGPSYKGYVTFNSIYGNELVKHLDRWFAGDFFVGFKTLNSYWKVPITDSGFKPMWEYAAEHRLPVLMHTWNGDYNSPKMLKDLVVDYPDDSYIFGHSGGGDAGRREVVELAQGNSNVYLEWCGSFCSSILWEDTLKEVDVSQVVFGSDAAMHSLAWELGRLLSVDVPDSVIQPILGGNMRRILQMSR